jgi:gas vesicle protein
MQAGRGTGPVCGRLELFGNVKHSLSTVERGGFIMAEENKSYGLAWFLAGLGVGALVGILYAPKSGKETREDIASGARESAEYLRARTREAAENVSAMVDRGKEQVSAIVDRSKEQMSEYVDRGREAVDRGRAQWEEFVERGKNIVADQTTRVTAAVDAGRQAYKTANGEPETHEY